MSSIQERLQLKRVPLDTWNVREQLCLASAVVRSGDQNWMSVSRALKTIGESNRPPDWYSQKSCAAQYGALLEHVETPKRKKRSSEGAVETPQESILKKLTQERIVEVQKNLAEMNQQYEQLRNELIEARNPATSEERLRELWASLEASKRAKERESARRAAWLKEREERRARAERTWRPGASNNTGGSPVSAPAASPLLTSLLKSSPVVTTPQHITHPANVVETISPSAGAPTLSMLLEKTTATPGAVITPGVVVTPGATLTPGVLPVTPAMQGVVTTPTHDNKHAAIEHIKNQLVQIENQLKASASPPPPPLAPPLAPPCGPPPCGPPPCAPPPSAPPPLDIDDIEIKAEDVYVFRDVDLHIPPVGALHTQHRTPEKLQLRRNEDITPIAEPELTTEIPEETVKIEPVVEEKVSEEPTVLTEESPEMQQIPQEPLPEPAGSELEAIKIAFPEVKFPTPEIKVIQPDEKRVKEDAKEADSSTPEPEKMDVDVDVESIGEQTEENSSVEAPQPEPPTEEPLPSAGPIEEHHVVLEDIPLPDSVEEPITEPTPLEPEAEPTQEEVKQESAEDNVTTEVKVEEKETTGDREEVKEDTKEKEEVEDPTLQQEPAREELSCTPTVNDQCIKEEPATETEETHTETDDDTPMELVREEDKDGKKRRDYSRKKKPDSRTCSGSESATEASAPESPSGTDAERQHRLWKKSVMLVYSRLCAHKYASLFQRPITDEEAPGYSIVVKRPMDLITIRRNIESGAIRTTAEFQRDILLMLTNALMYNSSEHSVYMMAKEMHEEAQTQLNMLVAAQAHAGLVAAPARRKRRPDAAPGTPYRRP